MGQRLVLPLAQIPSSFGPTLKSVSGDLQIYTHPHAVIFENDKTTVQPGLYDGDTPVAVKRSQWPKDEAQRRKALREKACSLAPASPRSRQPEPWRPTLLPRFLPTRQRR